MHFISRKSELLAQVDYGGQDGNAGQTHINSGRNV